MLQSQGGGNGVGCLSLDLFDLIQVCMEFILNPSGSTLIASVDRIN
ncbi:unnamed protein product [Musa acuminata subsp. malaccensis]|uniref:(wild Malaysian banana) hypothetical protein n=1 Tax=Musa acuminata subsp. malaccensis TaxID=214687 RepID=A0A804KVK5_MUSAM|nr:unnamed protein product [Musa acuminata subsp. malaccensis]